MIRVDYKFGRSISDPEKTILPTILFIDTNHPSFGCLRLGGFALVFGWWDFYFRVMITKK